MHQGLRSKVFAAFVLAVAVVMLSTATPSRAEDDVPSDVRKAILEVLQKKASDLKDMKDSSGLQYKRGTYSRTIRKAGDGSYEVNFQVDTVEGEGVFKTSMKTDRMIVTVAKTPAGTWSIVKETPVETVGDLRSFFVQEPVPFGGMSFQKEGLTVSTGPGWLVYVLHFDKVVRITVMADDMKYDYKVPPDVSASYNYYDIVQDRFLNKKFPEDIVFKPEKMIVFCDGATCDSLLKTAFKNAPPPAVGATTPVGGSASGTLPPAVKKAYDDMITATTESKKSNPFFYFDRQNDPDHRYWTFEFSREGGDGKAFRASYDNWEPWQVLVGTTRYGPIWGYYSEDVRKSNIAPYELESSEDSDARWYDVDSVDGTVELALEEDTTMRGDLTFGLTVKAETRTIPFRIERAQNVDLRGTKLPKLFIDSVQDADGKDLTCVRLWPGTTLTPLARYAGQFQDYFASRYEIVFPKPVPAGTKLKLRIQYTNQDGIAKYNPSFSQLNRGGWMPFVRFTDPIEDFNLTVRSPDRYKILGIGRKVSESKKDGVLTTRWTSRSPVSFPTIIFGEYIEDTPGFKAKKIDGTEIPVRVSVDKVATNDLDLSCGERGFCSEVDLRKIRESYDSGARGIRQSQLRAVADQAVNAMNLYAAVYGVDYPFDKLDLVNDPQGAFYGQAPASIIYLGWTAFRGEGALASGSTVFGDLGARIADLTKFNKDVVAHETAHQWWGSLINNANSRNYWFVESLAEYSSALFVENVYGRKRYLDKVADWRENVMANEMLSSVQNAASLWNGSGGGYQANVYNKGPYAFHVLRETFGDEKFFAFLKKLATDLKNRQIVTRDIQQVMEESFGGNMDWFMDQWLRGIGMPQYQVNYTVRPTEDKKFVVNMTVKQRVVFGKDKTVMPGVFYRALLPISVLFEDGTEGKLPKPFLMEKGEVTLPPFALPKAPKAIFINKDGQVLAHDVLYNQPW